MTVISTDGASLADQVGRQQRGAGSAARHRPDRHRPARLLARLAGGVADGPTATPPPTSAKAVEGPKPSKAK